MALVPVIYNGLPLLLAAGGEPKVYNDLAHPSGPPVSCCCVCGCCLSCPEIITLTLRDDGTCSCIAGQTILLTYDAVQNAWLGSSSFGPPICTMDEVLWRLVCSDNGDGVTNCRDFYLSFTGGGNCSASGTFANAGCVCDPFAVEFDFSVTGVGCCLGVDGIGQVHATATA